MEHVWWAINDILCLIAVGMRFGQPVLWQVIIIGLSELADASSSEHDCSGFIDDCFIALWDTSIISLGVSIPSHSIVDGLGSVLVVNLTEFLCL